MTLYAVIKLATQKVVTKTVKKRRKKKYGSGTGYKRCPCCKGTGRIKV